MKKISPFSRVTILIALILCYLLPVFGLISFNILNNDFQQAWQGIGIGLLISSLGSLCLFYMMLKGEMSLHPTTEIIEESSKNNTVSIEQFDSLSNTYHEAQDHCLRLQQQIDALLADAEHVNVEKRKCAELETNLKRELEDCQNSANEELKQQQQFIRTLQQTIAEQIGQLEKKQQQIGLLESKVGDLTYEIKTLLHIAESHTTSSSSQEDTSSDATQPIQHNIEEDEPQNFQNEKQISTPDEASIQLRRCLDIAQKITGSNRFSQMSAFLNSPADSFSIDLRRLCDSLRSENSCGILFYSPKEKQLLFANNQIKGLTGWTPDKFVQNFSKLLLDEPAWRNGIAGLAMRSEVPLKLSLMTKAGSEVHLNAHLGMIPTGIFKFHTLAVIY